MLRFLGLFWSLAWFYFFSVLALYGIFFQGLRLSFFSSFIRRYQPS
jgi:hypothetical protein